jgi:antitoxin YefM
MLPCRQVATPAQEATVNACTYSDARRDLARLMDQVCEDRTPLMITRTQAAPVVLMSLAEYQTLEETAHLLRSPANARRLLAAIRELET